METRRRGARPGGRLRRRWVGAWLTALLVVGCGDDGAPGDGQVPEAEVYEFELPPGFPAPKVPEDNPMSEARVELGRHLFYDKRLSGNQTQACASCHIQEFAFTDGLDRAEGSTGQIHPRGSMSLTNVAYGVSFGWANHLLRSLEDQALVPMFGEEPVELGLAGLEDELMERLRQEPRYQELFPAAFPGQGDPISLVNVTRAISAFERTLISGRSPYDRFIHDGEVTALSMEAQRGMRIFFSETADCFHCHGGFNFADAVTHEGKVFDELPFHNTGLYNVDGQGAYPATNTGLRELTGLDADMGRFKAPTLRNIAVTAPYMHDGSIDTLEGVIEHYMAGGRTIEEGPNAGDGSTNPNKSIFVAGFQLSDQNKADLVAFLEALTDEAFLTDPRFSNPWTEGPNADL